MRCEATRVETKRYNRGAVAGLGHHDLSCSRSEWHISRHAMLNDILYLARVVIAVHLETCSVTRDSGKSFDRMFLFHYVVSLASLLRNITACVSGAAASAKILKQHKFNNKLEQIELRLCIVKYLGHEVQTIVIFHQKKSEKADRSIP